MQKRRKNGEGTIYQRPNGLWVCEITLGFDADGKRLKKTLSSMDLEKLQKKINDTKFLADRGQLADPSSYTLSSWIEFWLENYKKNSIKPTTLDCYYYAYEQHIRDSIGHNKLDKVNPVLLQKRINEISDDGYSSSAISKVYIVLNQSMTQAVKNNLIYRNPCDAIILPKSKPRQVMALSADEQVRFEANCPDTTYGRMFLFALQTGMRIGEILALVWDDIDFENRIIYVNKTVSTVVNRDRTKDDPKTKQVIDTTKTKSGMRTIPMSNKCYDLLKTQEMNKTGVFCFSSANGKVIMGRNARKAFDKILEKAEISVSYTIHSLRHTFATRLIEKGANIKAVSEILGHKSIQITLDTYSHVSTDFKHDTINLLN